MIPVDNTQTIETSGAPASIGKVTTTVKNIPFLINAVTDRIYKDKPGAIVREYSTNAWDEHIKANLPITDILVTLPTLNDPVLRIRDFGTGLTMEDVRDIYCILGESTKRDSNQFNGQLGLGCKSGFAYGDSFVVTSHVNGIKTIYNVIKGDDHKEGDVLRMVETPMSEDERTGIEVAVPVKVSDLNTIHSKAADFFKYWTILPTILNMDESVKTRMNHWRNTAAFLSGNGWEIRPNSSSYGNSVRSVAVMGQVAYPIDWEMLRSKMALTPQKRIFTEILQSNEMVLQFPIGSLKFTINREELEYTDTTYKNLQDKIEEIFTTLEKAIIAKFAGAKTIWEAKRVYLALFGKYAGDREEGESIDDNALKVLDGDFYRLEDLFKGRLFWNKIEMTGPSFNKINRWDVSHSDALIDDLGEPITPCLVSYRRKRNRVKRLRCTATSDNRITPYNGTKVIVIDGRNVSMMQTIARYYLLQEGTTVNKLHLLRFANDAQKQAFFDHYHFETAEYTLLSTVIDDIKAWQKANRKSYSRSGGGGGGGGTALLRYINVLSGTVDESEVSLRDLENGGVYASCHRKAIQIGHSNVDQYSAVNALETLAKYAANLKLERVYLIPEAKLNAVWFQKAKAAGLWTELSKYLKENGEVYVSSSMQKQFAFQRFHNIADTNLILTHSWAQALNNIVSSPELNAYVDAIGGEPDDFSALQHAQRCLGLPISTFTGAPSYDYTALAKAILDNYPLMKYMGICGADADMDSKKLKAILEYMEALKVAKDVSQKALDF